MSSRASSEESQPMEAPRPTTSGKKLPSSFPGLEGIRINSHGEKRIPASFYEAYAKHKLNPDTDADQEETESEEDTDVDFTDADDVDSDDVFEDPDYVDPENEKANRARELADAMVELADAMDTDAFDNSSSPFSSPDVDLISSSPSPSPPPDDFQISAVVPRRMDPEITYTGRQLAAYLDMTIEELEELRDAVDLVLVNNSHMVDIFWPNLFKYPTVRADMSRELRNCLPPGILAKLTNQPRKTTSYLVYKLFATRNAHLKRFPRINSMHAGNGQNPPKRQGSPIARPRVAMLDNPEEILRDARKRRRYSAPESMATQPRLTGLVQHPYVRHGFGNEAESHNNEAEPRNNETESFDTPMSVDGSQELPDTFEGGYSGEFFIVHTIGGILNFYPTLLNKTSDEHSRCHS
ncbi:hypothetical protein TWF481_009140 [Arthrobotrys musiformis]|uniref:Uncharacterized protein n=1 Tax=Arthrobotrys musiformis TaxID=47236 RepID=A0AAV9W2W8_9PEZI